MNPAECFILIRACSELDQGTCARSYPGIWLNWIATPPTNTCCSVVNADLTSYPSVHQGKDSRRDWLSRTCNPRQSIQGTSRSYLNKAIVCFLVRKEMGQNQFQNTEFRLQSAVPTSRTELIRTNRSFANWLSTPTDSSRQTLHILLFTTSISDQNIPAVTLIVT